MRRQLTAVSLEFINIELTESQLVISLVTANFALREGDGRKLNAFAVARSDELVVPLEPSNLKELATLRAVNLDRSRSCRATDRTVAQNTHPLLDAVVVETVFATGAGVQADFQAH